MKSIILVVFAGVILAAGCSEGGVAVNMQTVAHGQQLYETHCSNCHQADGKGLARLIPPLLDADYLALNRADLPCIIRNGMFKQIVVNGVMYQQKMPANTTLSQEEITALVNFVEFRYGKSTALMSADSVQMLLQYCGSDTANVLVRK